MDTTTENGGSFAVDLNDNEEESGVGEVAGKAGHRSALKGRSLALLAGVSGGQEAEKAWTSVTSNGGGVNTAAPVQPPPHNTDIILDLEGCLSGRLADSCVVSGVCGDLNGFTESGGQEGGGEGLPLTGTTAASCPAGLRELVSAEEDGQRQEDPEGETRDCGSCIRTHLPPDRLPCTAAGDVNMPNGGVDSPAHSSPDGDTTYWKQTQVQDQRLSLSDVDCEQVKLANGGLHVVKSETHPDHLSFHWGAAEEKRPGWGHCLGSGPPGSLCPGQDAPAAAGRPHLPAPGSSANLPHSCPSTQSDSLPQSEPITGEDEEDFSDLCFPVRPHSLRTNPNHAMSLSCDATPLSADEDGGYYLEDGGYEEDLRNVLEAGRRQSAPDKLPDLTGSDGKMLPKRFGLADFFTRSLFSRKSKEPKAASHNASGWRLFGKTAATEDEETSTNTQEEEVDLSSCPQRPLVAARRKNLEFEPLSTTALILEDRPSNLPAKSMEETQRHKLEYEEMVAGAKKREMKDAQKKKRQMKERHRHEDSISSAMVIWNTEILPHWDTVKGTRRVRELWWQGLPPSVRGRVWSLAIGNELNITPELYEIFLSRAKEKWRSYSETSSVNDSESDGGASLADRESSLDLIKLDISRTFPSLFIFQKGGPYHDLLHSVLGAYTCYRPDIGYVQGMSFIAAVLILNLEEAEAFITFANLLNKPCQMAFFRVDHELMLKYFSAFEIFFEENLPRLFCHFQSNSLTPDLYLIDWIFTLYSKSLPLDVACRVWDVFCRDGEESLFRTGLGILRLYEDILLQMDFIHIAQFLSRLPEDLQSQTLFNAMATTHMISRTRRWAQVFSALMKDGNKEVEKNSSPALRS